MAGVRLSILRKEVIQIPVVSQGEIAVPPFAQLIDTLGWVSGAFLVRVFSRNVLGSATRIHIGVVNMMVGPDDPSVAFFEGDQDPLAGVEILFGTSSTPTLLVSKLPSVSSSRTDVPIGPYVGVYMTVNPNGGTATGGSMTISIDLVGRDA